MRRLFDRDIVATLVTVMAFAGLAYGRDLGLPFVGDDFVFLDETARANFASLWSRQNVAFDWYRPWSRELHFWLLQHVAGAHAIAFRSAGLILWFGVLSSYTALVRRLVGPKAATLATLGVASLALWGTPLLWVSGSQDLWLLFFGLVLLNLVAARRDVWGAPILLLALLSKETAVVLAPLATALAVVVQGDTPRRAIRRMAPLILMTVVWTWAHPTLLARILHPALPSRELASRPSMTLIALKNVLASVNASVRPRPSEITAPIIWLGLLSAIALGAGYAVATFRQEDAASRPAGGGRRVLWFAAIWIVLGWAPTFAPSIGWHAYYGCLGTLGVWIVVAAALEHHRKTAVAVLFCLGLLRAADAMTQTWDWGNEWYLRRAGTLLSAIEVRIKTLYPVMPRHARVYFGRLPNNIGLIAGQSAAIRVWYRDSTLSAAFFSEYRKRPGGGKDLFFRFDTVAVLQEIATGPEDVMRAQERNPEWAEDHTKLGMLMLGGGAPAMAAEQFEKVASLPDHAQEALYAAACWRLSGQPNRAKPLLRSFQQHTRLSDDAAEGLVRKLMLSAPIQGESGRE